MSEAAGAPAPEKAVFAKAARRLIPLLFACYVVAFLDRVNVGFAKLQMAGDLAFSDAVYGFGAGVFFFGYFLFEVPSNLVLRKVGARTWIARIMISWGIISSCFMFTHHVHWGPVSAALNLSDAEFTFYLLRFLLGAAEAGFFPGIILYLTYWFPADRRARMVALFMTAIAASNVVGSPISGAIMQFTDGFGSLRGWQWLFLLEGIPSVVMGLVVFARLPDGPATARWLNDEERALILKRVHEDEASKAALGQRHSLGSVFADHRIWMLATIYFCGNVCFYAVSFWMPTIVQELGLEPTEYLKVGLLSMIPWGAAAIAQVTWASHSDRTGERRWHAVAGLLLAMTGMLILAFAGHAPVLSIVALSFVTAGILSYTGVFWSLPTAFLSGAGAAAGIAFINSVGNLGGHFGPDLIGRIRTATGGDSQAAFFALAASALLGATIVLLLPKAKRIP
ncbi:MAG: MFS transporter [Terricaulis sp.]